jgi:pimeloyl-ACP methyl ester carboxylesterase
MAAETIDGLQIEYELLGDAGAPAIAVTPGGRFSKDSAGVRELGQALAEGGRRVLLWDRPNCGLSDVSFSGPSESALQGQALGQLIQRLDLGPTALVAGSGGSRVALLAAAYAPASVSHLALWWISGGAVGLMQLAYYYCCEAANLASIGGMEAVANAASWADQVKRNPRARETILSQDVATFVEAMQSWALAYRPPENSPVPGMAPVDFATLRMPVLIFRNGESDVSHPRATSDWVGRMIPHARVVDPPWPDHEWNDRMRAFGAGQAPGLFVNWPALAPALLEFVRR